MTVKGRLQSLIVFYSCIALGKGVGRGGGLKFLKDKQNVFNWKIRMFRLCFQYKLGNH